MSKKMQAGAGPKEGVPQHQNIPEALGGLVTSAHGAGNGTGTRTAQWPNGMPRMEGASEHGRSQNIENKKHPYSNLSHRCHHVLSFQADLHPSAETAAHRAIRTFTTATRDPRREFVSLLRSPTRVTFRTKEGLQDRQTNATSTLQFISQKVSALHATMKLVSTQSAAASTTVERRTAAYVAKMNEVLRAETQTLGLYTRDASTSRLRQSKLSQRALQDDLRELSLKFALRTLDESWWNLRSSLDRYLDAYDVYLRSFKQAVSMLDRYTQCGATFKDLKQAYSASKRGHDLEQQTLREAWTAAVPAIGLMAAQVVDTRMLQELAIDDAAKMMAKVTADGKNAQRLCQKDAALLLDIAQAAFKQGLFAQTVWQFHTLFDEMTMLRRRFARSRSVPDETALHAAEDRLAGAVLAVSINDTVLEQWLQWSSRNCPSLLQSDSNLNEARDEWGQSGKNGNSQNGYGQNGYGAHYGHSGWYQPWWSKDLMKQHQYIMQQQVVLHENTSETLQELMKQHQYIIEQQVALHENTSAALTNITQQLDVLTAALVPPSTSPIPTPPPGQCETDLPLTAPVCQDSATPCNLPMSNKINDMAATDQIFPGCKLLEEVPQELFKYCNDDNITKSVTIGACSSTLPFQVTLGAFLSSNTSCQRRGCVGNNGNVCGSFWLAGSADPRAIMTFSVAAADCVYIMQAPFPFGNATSTLEISSVPVLVN